MQVLKYFAESCQGGDWCLAEDYQSLGIGSLREVTFRGTIPFFALEEPEEWQEILEQTDGLSMLAFRVIESKGSKGVIM